VQDVAQFFKVLADPSRVALLWLLRSRGELCVCDLMQAVEIPQSKASRHLATLRHAGLVSDRKQGAWSYYALSPPAGDLATAQLAALWAGLDSNPEAARMLRRLDAWLLAKEHGAACASPDACRPGRIDRKNAPRKRGQR